MYGMIKLCIWQSRKYFVPGKREIIYLKGSITEEDIDAPEIDLKVVFGDDWKKSSQTYYRNILQEGKQIWQKI